MFSDHTTLESGMIKKVPSYHTTVSQQILQPQTVALFCGTSDRFSGISVT